eukprot:scaffold681_cov173-Ochromonas_danica.AAC.21
MERKIDLAKYRDYIPTTPSLCRCPISSFTLLLLLISPSLCQPALEVREFAQQQLDIIYEQNLVKDRAKLMNFLDKITYE